TLDKNLKAKASSKNPRDTFTVFNQPPDFGISFKKAGKRAKIINGIARAIEKPNMPIAGPSKAPLETTSASKYPIIGPVHENETSAKVNAIKKIPISPPLSDF